MGLSTSPTNEGDRMGKLLQEEGKEIVAMGNHGVLVSSKTIAVMVSDFSKNGSLINN